MQWDLDVEDEAAIAALTESNNARIATLAQIRTPQFPQGAIINIERAGPILEFLLNAIAGKSPERIEFERAIALQVADQLDKTEQMIRELTFTDGVRRDVPPPPDMLRS